MYSGADAAVSIPLWRLSVAQMPCFASLVLLACLASSVNTRRSRQPHQSRQRQATASIVTAVLAACKAVASVLFFGRQAATFVSARMCGRD